MAVATLVALSFRLYQIDVILPGLHYDAAFNGLVAKELLDTGRLIVFVEGNFGVEPMLFYLLAVIGRSG
ncbi:MAG: hypothetical protein Q7O66_09795 [Dehalococcoidia bacterium]|nr:hypothetical protein [Dehalococcoidia bacterium]